VAEEGLGAVDDLVVGVRGHATLLDRTYVRMLARRARDWDPGGREGASEPLCDVRARSATAASPEKIGIRCFVSIRDRTCVLVSWV